MNFYAKDLQDFEQCGKNGYSIVESDATVRKLKIMLHHDTVPKIAFTDIRPIDSSTAGKSGKDCSKFLNISGIVLYC